MAEQRAMEVVHLSEAPSAKDFYDKHISKRKPALIDCKLAEFESVFKNWKSNDYLTTQCESELVKVEIRNTKDEQFGKSEKVLMQFSQLLKSLASDESFYYMTVQDIPGNENGPFALFGAPLTSLHKEFPLRPSIFGNLSTHQINLWCGHSGDAKQGSSTGLHHDFHDNLYLVVRGTKRFHIYPPDCYPHLYVRGTVDRMYDNGLIVYKDGPQFREDGAITDASNVATDAINADVTVSKPKGSQSSAAAAKGSKEDSAENLLQIDSELDNMLDMAMAGGTSLDDDFEAMFDVTDASPVDEEELKEPPRKKRRIEKQSASDSETDEMDSTPPPPSFSQIDLKCDSKTILNQFPDYRKVKSKGITVTVNEGQMLYLPTGWFHEVTSISNPDLKSHLALSYWMYPPVTKGTFEQPYCDEYWAKRFDTLATKHNSA